MQHLTRNVLAALVVTSAVAVTAAQPPAAAGAGAKTWIGKTSEIEQFLRTADVERLEDIGTGVTKPRRAYLRSPGPFDSLVWKVLPPGMRGGYREDYKSEIAAYELDKLLHVDMVPPAVERKIDGETGAAIMWLDATTSVKQRGGQVPTGPAFGRPIRTMQLFDNLIGNIDRNAGNILIDRADNVILIDHSRAFITRVELPSKFERVDAQVWEKVQTLTTAQLSAALGAWLDREAIEAIIGRRDRLKSEVDKLVARKGRAAVIIP